MRTQNDSPSSRDRDRARDRVVVRHLVERIYSNGELWRIDDLVTPDCVGHGAESPETYHGPTGIKAHVIRLRRAFNGLTFEIDDLHVEGGTFEASWTARGTHERRFLGVDPTCTIGAAGVEPHGTEIAVPGTTTGTVRGGKVHVIRMEWDVTSLLDQLGSTGRDDTTAVDSSDSSTDDPSPSTETHERAAESPIDGATTHTP